MRKVIKLALLGSVVFVSMSSMAQSKLNCQIDPISGLPEATLDWQNTLGRDRADSWCRRHLMANQVDPADVSAEVAGYVSMRGHAPGAMLRRVHGVPASTRQDVEQQPPMHYRDAAVASAGGEYVQIKTRH